MKQTDAHHGGVFSGVVPPRRRHRFSLLSKRFRYADRTTLLGQAHLFGDRIELVRWTLAGRRTRTLRFDRIAQMDYHPLENGSNLTLYLDTGEVLEICIQEAHRWRQFFEHWFSYHVSASAKVLAEPEQVAALSG